MSELLAWGVPVLGRALMHFLWQGAAIGLLAAALLHALRGARPQARYAVACLALLACALAPVLDVLSQLASHRLPSALPAVGSGVALLPALGEATRVLAQPAGFDDALPTVVALWAAGACVLSLRMALGVWWIQRLCARPCAVSAPWQARLDALALRFGLRRRVTLRVVGTLDSPASVGWWRPVVLLPAALLARMPVELVEALVAHELAHIRRHDYLVNLLQGVVEALLFYHPATWWLSRRIRRERELIADQLAADVIAAPRTLARALSALSEHAGCPAPARALPSPALAAHGGHLMSRIEQLVRPRAGRSGGRVAFPLLGVAAACIALLAHAQSGGAAASSYVAQARADEVRDVRIAEHASATPFALVRKDRDGITMSGDVRYAELVDAMRDDMRGDFLWFRRGGQGYVIEDADIIARVGRAWEPTDEFGRRMQVLSSRMEVHGRKMEALGARMQAQSAQRQGDPEMQAAARQMEVLGGQQQRLAEQHARLAARLANADVQGRERLEREMDALDAQQDALDEQMDAQSQRLEAASARQEEHSASMEAISQQMEEAGKPMEALGEQMDALGEQMDVLSERAERETLALIDEAVAKGLAKPAPARK